MSERYHDWEQAKRILDNLKESKLEKVFTDKEEFARFLRFLREKVIPAGNLLIGFPLTEGGYAWFKYRVGVLQEKKGKQIVGFSAPAVYMPEDDLAQSVPPELHEIPIWKLGG